MFMTDTEIANRLDEITRAVSERIKGEWADDNAIDLALYKLGDHVTATIFDAWSESGYGEDMTDEDRDEFVTDALNDALGELAESMRYDDSAAHEWADSDRRVIYTAETLDFYRDNMSECDEAYENVFGNEMQSGDISASITTAVYLVIRQQYEQEISDLADAIEDYEAEDFI